MQHIWLRQGDNSCAVCDSQDSVHYILRAAYIIDRLQTYQQYVISIMWQRCMKHYAQLVVLARLYDVVQRVVLKSTLGAALLHQLQCIYSGLHCSCNIRRAIQFARSTCLYLGVLYTVRTLSQQYNNTDTLTVLLTTVFNTYRYI
jgi:hypothetical protein